MAWFSRTSWSFSLNSISVPGLVEHKLSSASRNSCSGQLRLVILDSFPVLNLYALTTCTNPVKLACDPTKQVLYRSTLLVFRFSQKRQKLWKLIYPRKNTCKEFLIETVVVALKLSENWQKYFCDRVHFEKYNVMLYYNETLTTPLLGNLR